MTDPATVVADAIRARYFGDADAAPIRVRVTPVTRLPLGATRRNPDGYASEAEYLAAVRQPQTMRLHPGARRKARFDSIPPRDGSRYAREQIGGRAYRERVIERRIVGEIFGVPNLITGA